MQTERQRISAERRLFDNFVHFEGLYMEAFSDTTKQGLMINAQIRGTEEVSTGSGFNAP